jgi:spore coat polysaccharide biosynthesis predicted glycosyltransferase SpsG
MKHSCNKCLVIRVDASTQMGTGHLMRCLALGQAWRDSGGHAIFAMAMEAPKLEMRLQAEGMEVIHLSARPGSDDDAIQTAHLARRRDASWIVADGYHFGANYQRTIKEAGLRLLFIDDDGQAEHSADIVLNQNLHARRFLCQQRIICLLLEFVTCFCARSFAAAGMEARDTGSGSQGVGDAWAATRTT